MLHLISQVRVCSTSPQHADFVNFKGATPCVLFGYFERRMPSSQLAVGHAYDQRGGGETKWQEGGKSNFRAPRMVLVKHMSSVGARTNDSQRGGGEGGAHGTVNMKVG